jgi:hypothetical protein
MAEIRLDGYAVEKFVAEISGQFQRLASIFKDVVWPFGSQRLAVEAGAWCLRPD